jgi:RNA polymerase sigma-70 factor (ECF subfamily)
MSATVDIAQPIVPASTSFWSRSRDREQLAITPHEVRSEALDEAHELSLMRRVAEQDIAAYRELVDEYLPRIARFAERSLGNKAEAEDVAQETFLRLWTAAADFTPQARPSTWLYRIAHNLCVDRFRKRGRETELSEASGTDRPSGLYARKQTSEAVQKALDALPERQRAAIGLVHYEGLAAQEAASVLSISVEALESLLSRARRSLRERLRSLAIDSQKELS